MRNMSFFQRRDIKGSDDSFSSDEEVKDKDDIFSGKSILNSEKRIKEEDQSLVLGSSNLDHLNSLYASQMLGPKTCPPH